MADMSSFSSLASTFMGLISTVTGTGVSVYGMSRTYQQPPAYAQQMMPGQPCGLQQGNQLLNGTFVVVEHADGKRTLECVPSGNPNQ